MLLLIIHEAQVFIVYIYFLIANRARFDKTQVLLTTIPMFSILTQAFFSISANPNSNIPKRIFF